MSLQYAIKRNRSGARVLAAGQEPEADEVRYSGDLPQPDGVNGLVVDGDIARLPNEAEAIVIQAAKDAAQAAKAAADADKQELRAQFQAAADDLQQIADATFANNGQRDTAIKRLAVIQRRMLRAVFALLRAE